MMYGTRGVKYGGIWIITLFLAGCQSSETQWFSLSGNTMGSTYHIQYSGAKNYQREIDDLLKDINDALSTYKPTSVISQFNERGNLVIPLAKNGEPADPLQGHFFANLEEAYEIYKLSNGFFDPTVGPLVEAWGFGRAGHQSEIPDSSLIGSLLTKVGMEKVEVKSVNDTLYVNGKDQQVDLDFSALAQGYATDRVFDLLKGKGVQDMFVEITGEVRVSGKSERGDDWIVGINVPEEEADLKDIAARIRMHDNALATSGNYRNYYMLKGRKVWHTINPKTGYPEENNLLSATIVHPRCMTADALATASMAMGADDAIDLIRKVPGAQGYFIYRNASGEIATFVTDNLTQDLLPE